MGPMMHLRKLADPGAVARRLLRGLAPWHNEAGFLQVSWLIQATGVQLRATDTRADTGSGELARTLSA
jgi:hypothetical protein